MWPRSTRRVRDANWLSILLWYVWIQQLSARIHNFNIDLLAPHVASIYRKTCGLTWEYIGANPWTVNVQLRQVDGFRDFNLKMRCIKFINKLSLTENGVSSTATLSSTAQITYLPGLYGTNEIFCCWAPLGDCREVGDFRTLSTSAKSGS
jgi:hypothetical protein